MLNSSICQCVLPQSQKTVTAQCMCYNQLSKEMKNFLEFIKHFCIIWFQRIKRLLLHIQLRNCCCEGVSLRHIHSQCCWVWWWGRWALFEFWLRIDFGPHVRPAIKPTCATSNESFCLFQKLSSLHDSILVLFFINQLECYHHLPKVGVWGTCSEFVR